MLAEHILELTKRLSITMGVESDINLVDSVPCQIVKNSRERGFTIRKEDPDNAPRKGFSTVDKQYYIHYKLHSLINEFGVFQDCNVTPANAHDIAVLKNLDPKSSWMNKQLVRDKGYISATVQTSLFDEYKVDLKVPYRGNQKVKILLDPELDKKRRRIKTQFSQRCDQSCLKHNYAKTFIGFFN